MTAMSNYLEDALINAVLRNTSYSSPATVYLALYTSNPDEGDTGTELSGNGYSRQSIAFNAPSNGAATNNGDVAFTASGGNFGTVTHIGIFDAATTGNLLFYGALTASKTVNDGETLTFADGSGVTVTLA